MHMYVYNIYTMSNQVPEETIELAVNGTLMRGLELNHNLLNVGAYFIRDDETEPSYRLYSINNRHPAMMKVKSGSDDGGRSIRVEVWAIPISGISKVLMLEPAGLCIGKITLIDGTTTILGVLGESWLCHEQNEITDYGGWRSYIAETN